MLVETGIIVAPDIYKYRVYEDTENGLRLMHKPWGYSYGPLKSDWLARKLRVPFASVFEYDGWDGYFQRYIENAQAVADDDFVVRPSHVQQTLAVVVFEWLSAVRDRHGWNYIVANDNVYSIDHDSAWRYSWGSDSLVSAATASSLFFEVQDNFMLQLTPRDFEKVARRVENISDDEFASVSEEHLPRKQKVRAELASLARHALAHSKNTSRAWGKWTGSF